MIAPVARLRAQLGLPPGRNPLFEGQHSPTLVLALFSKVLGEAAARLAAEHARHRLPLLRPPRPRGRHRGAAPELLEFLDAGEPPVVFTLGSSAFWAAENFYTESVEAARAVGRRALLLIGDERNRPRRAAARRRRGLRVRALRRSAAARRGRRPSGRRRHDRPGAPRRSPRARRPLQPRPVRQRHRVARAGCGLRSRARRYNAARAAAKRARDA